GSGGAFVVWQDFRLGADYDIYARRVDGSGLALWLDDGVVLCAAPGNQTSPQLVSDGTGGAIVAWQDARGNGNQATDLYVQGRDGRSAMGRRRRGAVQRDRRPAVPAHHDRRGGRGDRRVGGPPRQQPRHLRPARERVGHTAVDRRRRRALHRGGRPGQPAART